MIGHRRIHFGQQPHFQVLALGQAFLNEIGIAHRFGDAGGEGDRAFRRQCLAEKPGQRSARVGDYRSGLAFHLRIGIEDRDVDPVEHEARRPACADHPAADNPNLADFMCHVRLAFQRFVSLSFSRTSAGPIMR